MPYLLRCLGPTDPPEYPWLYAIPAMVFSGGYVAAASTGVAGLVQAGYLVSTILCMGKSDCPFGDGKLIV